MQKQCKHFWMLLEEYSKAIDDDRTYIVNSIVRNV